MSPEADDQETADLGRLRPLGNARFGLSALFAATLFEAGSALAMHVNLVAAVTWFQVWVYAKWLIVAAGGFAIHAASRYGERTLLAYTAASVTLLVESLAWIVACTFTGAFTCFPPLVTVTSLLAAFFIPAIATGAKEAADARRRLAASGLDGL